MDRLLNLPRHPLGAPLQALLAFYAQWMFYLLSVLGVVSRFVLLKCVRPMMVHLVTIVVYMAWIFGVGFLIRWYPFARYTMMLNQRLDHLTSTTPMMMTDMFALCLVVAACFMVFLPYLERWIKSLSQVDGDEDHHHHNIHRIQDDIHSFYIHYFVSIMMLALSHTSLHTLSHPLALVRTCLFLEIIMNHYVYYSKFIVWFIRIGYNVTTAYVYIYVLFPFPVTFLLNFILPSLYYYVNYI
ncbi:unnamed protein product [Absidia cylindrospora]